MRLLSPRRGVLPGFGLSLGVTLAFGGFFLVLPLAALTWRACATSPHDFWAAISGPRALAAYRLSLAASLAGATVNAAFGLLVAWVLTRYRFPGKALLDALVDLPFALPTAVAGIALTAIYSEHGWLGRHLPLAYTPIGVGIALTFVGLPFVVRTVQPVLLSIDPRNEEAAAILGAGRTRIFISIILPSLAPALVAGFTLAFSRALGEYGSVVFISGNMPFKTEIVPLLIMTKLEQYDYGGATAIALVMLVASFLMLVGANAVQARLLRKSG